MSEDLKQSEPAFAVCATTDNGLSDSCSATSRRTCLLVLVLFGGFITSCAAGMPEVVSLGPWQEVISLNTRPGVTVRIFLMTPATAPKAVFLFLLGGEGQLVDSVGRARGMFLPRRSREIVDEGFVSAALDVPSDQAFGMGDRFRISKEHLEDINQAINFLSSKWPIPIFVLGISRGTLSAAHVASSLKHPSIQGIVLASSLTGRIPGPGNEVSLFDLPLENATMPVLIIHHRDDGCRTTSFNDALRLPERFRGSPKVTFIEVLGGEPPRSEPCLLFSPHGFFGKEREVIAAVIAWSLGKPVRVRIGP